MKKKVILSFLILASSTAFSKCFSLLNRIVLARLLDKEGMGLYMLVLPTLSLCITLSELGVPNAVFRLIASPKYKNHKVIFTSLCLGISTSIIVAMGIMGLAPFISHSLLKSEETYLSILSLAILIPMLSLNAILKNYYLGIGYVGKLSICQFLEEIARLAFTILILTGIPSLSLGQKVMVIYLSMAFEEVIAFIFLMIALRRKLPLFRKLVYHYHENFIYKDILTISLPHTSSRLLGSFASFLQPILLTQFLLALNYDSLFIKESYGVLTGYVMALLSTPSFFTGVVYRILLPLISEDLYHHKNALAFKHMCYGLIVCLMFALPFTTLFYFFPNESLTFLYGTSEGASWLKYMAIPYITSYLQTPFSVVLQALNKNKLLLMLSLFQCVCSLIFLVIFIPHFQVLSVGISSLLTTTFTLGLSAFCVIKGLFKNRK